MSERGSVGEGESDREGGSDRERGLVSEGLDLHQEPHGADRRATPADIDRHGVPGDRAGREGFILAAALLVAVLGLVFTLGWVVYHQIT